MYIDSVPNRNSPPAILLRQSRRENGKMVKETIANLTACPPEAIAALKMALAGVKLVPAQTQFAIERSTPHGHIQAVVGMMRKLGMDALLASRPCRQRDLVMAMIAQRIVEPCSKLATARLWNATTLAAQLGVADACANDLYDALDWLGERQERIEKKLAARHLSETSAVLYDVSSSSYHGRTCPLAAYGYNRDGEKLPSIVFGLLTDSQGLPVAVEVYKGNTADPATVPDQVEKLRERFALERLVLVGDRGMLTQTRIKALRDYPGLGWISALRFGDIRKLADENTVQPSLFDQCNLAEIESGEFPGERLVACFNPLLAQDRQRTRNELLEATEKLLEKLVTEVTRRTHTPLTAAQIGVKAGTMVHRHKMAKHFTLDIADGHFAFARDAASIERERQLDGIYVIRTSEPSERLSAQDTVRTYKSLGQVEQAFRCIKSVDIHVRPIRHRVEERVRAHIFVCMLAYYVEWHLRKALAPVLFEDETLDEERWRRDPVAKAEASDGAKQKKKTKQTPEGQPVHSLRTLLQDLASRCKNLCRCGEGKTAAYFETLTEMTAFQRKVFELLGVTP